MGRAESAGGGHRRVPASVGRLWGGLHKSMFTCYHRHAGEPLGSGRAEPGQVRGKSSARQVGVGTAGTRTGDR